jgi:hypothetical protein
MPRVAAHITVAVPAALCQEAVQAALSDPRVGHAMRQLRPGKEYSGFVTAVTPGRRLEIAFASLDAVTGRRAYATGWRVTYEFLPLEDGHTRVEVAVTYGLLAALAGAGLLRPQAENEVAHRVMALYALELGLRRGDAPAPTADVAGAAAMPLPGGGAGGHAWAPAQAGRLGASASGGA